jgi:hypothetical protein
MPDGGHTSLIQKGAGPGGQDLVVDTAALRAGARALSGLDADFAARSAGFSSRVHLHGHAFGSLPQAQEPYREYVRTVASAQAALDAIRGQIDQVASALVASADNYDGADSP